MKFYKHIHGIKLNNDDMPDLKLNDYCRGKYVVHNFPLSVVLNYHSILTPPLRTLDQVQKKLY